jgi:hypothetical protein
MFKFRPLREKVIVMDAVFSLGFFGTISGSILSTGHVMIRLWSLMLAMREIFVSVVVAAASMLWRVRMHLRTGPVMLSRGVSIAPGIVYCHLH